MSRRTSRNNSYTSGISPSGFYIADVVTIDGDYVSVKVPRLGLDNIYENVPFTGFTPSVGDRIWVSFVEGKASHLLGFVGAGDTSTDITEIVAGTNLNGGGTGGSITLNLDDDITLSTVTADGFYGDLYGAIHILVKNVSGGSLTKGTPVYATGAVGASGAVEVEASLAGTASTMPAMGLLDQDLVNNGEGDVVVSGVLQNFDTDTPGYSVGDELYIAASGGLTTTRPTGSSELVQKIGKVIRVQQNTGEILVQGAGRTNDVPNSFSITGDMTVGGDATVTGDLTVNGTTVTLNTETLTVEDNIIVLNSNVSGTPTLDAGIEIERGTSANVSFLWDESNDRWTLDSESLVAGTFIGGVEATTMTASGDLAVDTDTLFVDVSEDRVGINDSTPSYSLDVAGDIRATGRVLTDLIGTSGGDDLGIGAGETANYMSGNIAGEHLWLGAEGNINLVTSPDNWVSGWAGRDETHLTPLGDGSLRVTTDSGYIDIGPKNSTYCHIYTDRGSFYFNKSTLYANSTSNVIWHAGNDGAGSGLDADTLDGSHASSFITTSTTQSNNIFIRNGSPTLYLRDTNHRSAMIHVNSNLFYVLRGNGNDSTTWETYNGHWPMQINLNDNNVTFGGDIYMRAVNANRPSINRVGGIYFTWDSDSYGTNTHHSIRSTNGDTWTDAITINSFGNVRINFDSNSNGTNTFSIGHATTGTGNTLLTLDESGNLTVYGYIQAATNNADPVLKVGDDAWIGDTDAANTIAFFGNSNNDRCTLQFGRYSGAMIAGYSASIDILSRFFVPNLLTTTGNNTLRYDGNSSEMLKFTSLREKKDDITSIKGVLDYLNEESPLQLLNPVIFHEKDQILETGEAYNSTRGEYVYGFIAEEVHEVIPESTFTDSEGNLVSFSNDSMVALLVAEVQRLTGLVHELYADANPDWVAPQARPAERSDAEKAIYDAKAAELAAAASSESSE